MSNTAVTKSSVLCLLPEWVPRSLLGSSKLPVHEEQTLPASPHRGRKLDSGKSGVGERRLLESYITLLTSKAEGLAQP